MQLEKSRLETRSNMDIVNHADGDVRVTSRGSAPSSQGLDPISHVSFTLGDEAPLALRMRHCAHRSAHTGGHIWSASRHLAQWLYGRRAAIPGCRILEIGCGLALPSILAAKLGASVVATDSLPSLLEHLLINAQLNSCAATIETPQTLDFSLRSDVQSAAARGPFHLIMFSDIVYGGSEGSALPYALAELLRSSGPSAAAVGVFPNEIRSGVDAFWQHAASVLEWSKRETARDDESDPRCGRLYVFRLRPGGEQALDGSRWAKEDPDHVDEDLAPLF